MPSGIAYYNAVRYLRRSSQSCFSADIAEQRIVLRRRYLSFSKRGVHSLKYSDKYVPERSTAVITGKHGVFNACLGKKETANRFRKPCAGAFVLLFLRKNRIAELKERNNGSLPYLLSLNSLL